MVGDSSNVKAISASSRSPLSEAFRSLIRQYLFVAWALWATVVILTFVNAGFAYSILGDPSVELLPPTNAPTGFGVFFAVLAGLCSLLVRNLCLSKKVFDRDEEVAQASVKVNVNLSSFELRFLRMIPRWGIVNFATWLLNAAISIIGMFLAIMEARFGVMIPFLVVSFVFNLVMRPDWEALVEKWK